MSTLSKEAFNEILTIIKKDMGINKIKIVIVIDNNIAVKTYSNVHFITKKSMLYNATMRSTKLLKKCHDK